MLSFNLKIKQRLLHRNIVLDKDSEGGGREASRPTDLDYNVFVHKKVEQNDITRLTACLKCFLISPPINLFHDSNSSPYEQLLKGPFNFLENPGEASQC